MGRPGQTINIGPRLTAAFLSVALLTLASGSVGLIGFQRASEAADILVSDAEMIRRAQAVRAIVASLTEPPTDFLLTGDLTARERYHTTIDRIQILLTNYVAVHDLHRHSVEHALPADDLIDRIESNVGEMTQLEALLFDTRNLDDATAPLLELELLITNTNAQLDQLLENAEADIEFAKNNHAAAERNAFVGLTVSALLAIGLAIGLAFAFSRSISVPLARLAKAADRIAGGDLSSPVKVRGAGEIGRLADAFERMRYTLARERGQLRLLAVLEERDRIGREMHDGLAQVLGYVNTKAQAINEYLRSGESASAERHVEELVAAAREAYTDAREAIVGLRMDGVGQRRLDQVLAEYIEQFARRTDAATELVVDPDWTEAELTPTARVQLLRIVQEALTNVRKHAAASRATVSLATDADEAIIRVEDDGRGFNLSRLLRPDYDRYGLRTMRERAQAIGGTFRIESSVGRGTCIIVRAPRHQLEEDRRL